MSLVCLQYISLQLLSCWPTISNGYLPCYSCWSKLPHEETHGSKNWVWPLASIQQFLKPDSPQGNESFQQHMNWEMDPLTTHKKMNPANNTWTWKWILPSWASNEPEPWQHYVCSLTRDLETKDQGNVAKIPDLHQLCDNIYMLF